MSKYRFRFFVLSLLSLLIATSLLAQGSAGTLVGFATDASGAALPGVTITATNDATGFTRSTVSAADGAYRLSALPPGKYTVTAELQGFSTLTTKNVDVIVATDRPLNVTLKQAKVSEQITVTAEAPLIASEPAVGTVVSQKELQNLPLNGRQFANLGTLAPGTTLAVNSDPTKPGQLTIALNGGSGRNVNYMIDGGDNTDDTIGGALQNFNLEAVQEFKIQTMQYKAEFGRSSGGVLSVVTKTGTNDFSGSAYEFFRDKSLNAKTESEILAGAPKSDYRRDQYGASFGGPIVKDKAHFFVTYEEMKRKTNYVVDTGGLYPQFDGSAVPTPFTDKLATGKASVNLTPAQFLQVRFGYQKNTDIYGASPLSLPNALGTTANKYSSALLSHSWQVGGDKVNDFDYQYSKFDNTITANSQDPTFLFPSGVVAGQNVNTPQSTHQVKHQFKDDFSFSKTIAGQQHNFKTGINFINEPTLSGDFSTGLTGQYTMLQDSLTSPVTDITINGGFLGQSTPIKEYSIYGQDDWAFNKNLTLNIGVRYDLWTGFDLNQSANPIFQELRTQRTYNEQIFRDFWGAPDSLKNDTNNIAPRLGLTFDVKGDGRHIIRAGGGRFYDFPYVNATLLFPASAVQSNYGVAYEYTDPNGIKNANGTFWKPGDPLPPNQVSTGSGVFPPNEVASPTLTKVPYSDQYSLGYSWEVSNTLGFNFEAVSSHYKDIPFRFRANSFLDATGKPMGSKRFPDFGNFRMWESGGRANYNGANIGFHTRLAQTFELQGFYTYSKATGNILGGADEFRISGSDFQPDTHRVARDVSVDPTNPWCSACFGPLYSDARHKLTLGGVYTAPYAINLSGVFRYHSATPYNVVNAALHDTNGDGFRQDLAPGVSHVNTGRGHAFSQFDLRLSKEFKVGPTGIEGIVEMFNVFNSKNPAKYNRLGEPTTYAGDISNGQQEQRLMQLGLRVHF